MPQNGNKSFKKRKVRFRIFNSTSLPILLTLFIYLLTFNENYEQLYGNLSGMTDCNKMFLVGTWVND